MMDEKDLTVQEALSFLRKRGYRLNKAMQYDENIIYLVKRQKGENTPTYGTRRTFHASPTCRSNTTEIAVAKIDLRNLDWKEIKPEI